jgi:hypothetical protein
LQAAENSGIDERSSLPVSADSSPPRKIAALTPLRIVAAPSNLFNKDTPANLFISPHIRKWDPIVNGRLEKTLVDNVDYTHMILGGLNGLLKRQGEQNKRAMHNILGHTEATQKAGGTKKQASVPHAPRSREETETTPPTHPHTGTDGASAHVGRLERKGLRRVVQETRPKLALWKKNQENVQGLAKTHKVGHNLRQGGP